MFPSFDKYVEVPWRHASGKAKGRAFSLVELLVVMSIMGALTMLALPALSSLKGGQDMTKAAYDIGGLLENARAYAIANNTYVWVGFYEEDGSKQSTNPASAGVGRVVISSVVSKDGTTVYDPTDPGSLINPAELGQLGPLVKIEHAHLASFTDGSGTGVTFATRPPVNSNNGRIGSGNPPEASKFPFQYPVGNQGAVAQYTFVKTIQFNPRGENTVNSTYSMRPVVEIGLQPARGSAVQTKNNDVAAIQITGIGGSVNIYK